MRREDLFAGIDGLPDGLKADGALLLVDTLKDRMHDDKFVSMSTEAQLLYMYLILDSGTGKDRPRALCRMLFHDDKDPLRPTPRVYPYSAYDELCRRGFISHEEED